MELLFYILGSCTDRINGFECACKAGFSGLRCEEDINECLQVSCGNGLWKKMINISNVKLCRVVSNARILGCFYESNNLKPLRQGEASSLFKECGGDEFSK